MVIYGKYMVNPWLLYGKSMVNHGYPLVMTNSSPWFVDGPNRNIDDVPSDFNLH